MTLFNSNCTLPHDVVTIVSQPNTRGTFDILWTCFATIFLCTWSSQHPNVPALKEIRKRKLKGLPSKLFMMLFCLVVPEFQLMKAIGELYCARKLTKSLQDRFGAEGPQWSNTHSFFTNMGGFVIQFTGKNYYSGIGSQAENATIPSSTAKLQATSIPHSTVMQTNSGQNQDVDCVNAVACASNTSEPPTVSNLQNSSTSENPVRDVNSDQSQELDTSRSSVHVQPPEVPTHTTTDANSRQNQDVDCEQGIAPPPPNTTRPENSLTVPWKKNLRTAKDKQAYRFLGIRISSLPAADSPNSLLVQDILENLKRKAYLEKDGTGLPFDQLIDITFNLIRLRGDYWALDGPQLILAHELGVIRQIPNVSTSNIDDKNSGDFLVKFLAVIQVGWQIIQLIIRWVKKLPTSQVEVVTVGFALCTLCTYLFYWSKPQDVQVPFLVQAKRYPTQEELYRLAQKGPAYIGTMYPGPHYSIPEYAFHQNVTQSDSEKRVGIDDWLLAAWIGALACAVAFGCLHCTAWNFHFPTKIERDLWRGASLMTSGLPIALGARGLLWMAIGILSKDQDRVHERKFSAHTTIGMLFDVVATVLYAGARLFLLAETIRSSFFLVPDVFLTSF